MLILNSWNLDYFNTGEWQVVEERLDDLESKGIRVCPRRDLMFKALDTLALEKVRVVIVGQDPYPTYLCATGIAFSIPSEVRSFPPTLKNIFAEYCSDLHYPEPKSGDLTPWVKQGVLLWNAIPSCTEGQPASHRWIEWEPLTIEILQKLPPTCVLVCLGNVALSLAQCVPSLPIVHTSHPSPLGAKRGSVPFTGSRLFSTINGKLCELGQDPIDWRL